MIGSPAWKCFAAWCIASPFVFVWACLNRKNPFKEIGF